MVDSELGGEESGEMVKRPRTGGGGRWPEHPLLETGVGDGRYDGEQRREVVEGGLGGDGAGGVGRLVGSRGLVGGAGVCRRRRCLVEAAGREGGGCNGGGRVATHRATSETAEDSALPERVV